VLRIGGGQASPTAAVSPSAQDRLLVMAEPASPHWKATVDGHALTSRQAYGWAQAWELPKGGGHLAISYDSGSRHWWLLIELLFMIGVLLFGAGAGSQPRRRGHV
jgi:hypothetical protein